MIILDTNFMIYLMKYKLSYDLEEHKKELVIPIQAVKELKTLSKQAEKIKDRENAKLALILLEKWNVKTIDGHSIKQIYEATKDIRSHKTDKPLVIFADTVKGKGIKSWENIALKHGIAPKGGEANKLLKELEDYSSQGEYEK